VNSQEEEMDIPESKESFSESRTIIKLDLQVGSLHLQDQFEWPLMPEVHRDGGVPYPSPESFAQQLCSDIGIGGEFVSLISHNIREQLYNARLNYEEVPKTNDLEIFRDDVHLESWGPTVRDVDEDEIEKKLQAQERALRRLRRSQKTSTIVLGRRGGSTDHNNLGNQMVLKAPNSYQIPNQFSPGRGYSSFSALPPQYTGYNPNMPYRGDPSLKPQIRKIPYQYFKPNKEEDMEILKKLEETANISTLPTDAKPPKNHRGFGASARVFNEDGSVDVGEFRMKWKCAWCLLSGKFTPTLRRGPMGSKTLCNSCGIWYGKHGNLPKERYHEHAND
jgi:hypothetical protein